MLIGMSRLLLAIVTLLLAPIPAPASDDALWNLLREGGQVILIRHAATDMSQRDEVGTPLADCSRQRNLTDHGRADARRINEVFRARKVPVGRVLSSAYCRCLETARLGFGSAEIWLPLQSALRSPEIQSERTAQIRALAGEPPASGNLVLVSHQFTIRAVTGINVGEGEMLVLTPRGGGTFDVAGQIAPEDLLPP
jgi:broad specificity phosphatase PhoE